MAKGGPKDRTAAPLVPERGGLAALQKAAAGCTACDLFENATQTVFGEGPAGAKVMFVGEQPGDKEDREGAPFVGPAGRILDQGLGAAGIPRDEVYVTNAVKHFKWKPAPTGKRRIHAKPTVRELKACEPWLLAEIRTVKPLAVVALGATAAQQLLGHSFRITRQRGEVFETAAAPWVMATIHPSAIVRSSGRDERHAAFEAFVDDLRKVAARMAELAEA